MFANFFRRLPLGRKLVTIMMLTATSVLIIFSVAEVGRELIWLRSETAEELESLTEVIAQNSAAALVFGDRESARVTLSALQAKPSLLVAQIVTPDGKLFVEYRSSTYAWDEIPAGSEIGNPSIHQGEVFHFDADHIDIARAIRLDHETLGLLYLQFGTDEYLQELTTFLAVVAAVFALTLFGALYLSTRLQRLISDPIIALARAAEAAGRERDYRQRVYRQTDDEIGALVDHFNAMLGQIEDRDRHVERLLAERTRERAFLQDIIDAVPEPVMVIAADYRVRLLNKAGARLAPAGVTDLRCYQVHGCGGGPCDRSGVRRCPLSEVRISGHPVIIEHECGTPEGGLHAMEITAAPLLDAEGGFVGIVESEKDITDRRIAEIRLLQNQERLDHLAHHDTLTGLPNRLLFQERFDEKLGHAHRENATLALLFLDLDRFKNVNDTFGHAIGDRLLEAVTHRLRQCMRLSDTVARLGGDEFAIILEPVPDLDAVSHVARKINDVLSQVFDIEGHELYVGTSVGISLFPVDGHDVETLCRNADAAMYLAKQEGRGTFRYFTADMNESARRRLDLEVRLRHALERGELELHFQPQLALEHGVIRGTEAQPRWHVDGVGLLAPAEFIPVAEESGLILPIGEWVMETACRQAVAWQALAGAPLRVAVNLSARQFRQQKLVHMVRDILARTGLAPGLLDLELTESILLSDVESAIALMHELRALGVNLSLDDFGTGYSSLSYLNQFPIQHLKVAQEFVRHLPQDRRSRAIAEAVVLLAHSLDIEVVAEGVETEAQFDYFRRLGCAYIQGDYFSRPLPAREFEDLLRAKPPRGEARQFAA
ncbi:bifunctional diguanylate cyclase/phosphodiesterase [Aromatoleum evansii]|uniref:bifunctional diguanylate cyclase/phosphodiesterase n=1 Tax=Aromatoleum evansii TaxID=59406 RepID=UPI00145E2090|nr:EAL domain-containing protein [Aromatoleum evansii]NMG31617.1 EAL domain-containing protein [Aromatoleum evansii]